MKIPFVIVLTTTLLVSSTACEKLEGVRYGNDIVFGARSGDEATKASYSGAAYNSGGKEFERIDWNVGDKVRIWCAQASQPASHYAEYVVSELLSRTSDRYSDAKIILSETDNEIGLRWGTGVHKFYSVYPSPLVGGVTGSIGTASGTDGSDVCGSIGLLQSVSDSDISISNGNYTAEPQLFKEMMLVGNSSVDASVGVPSGSVFMQYRPVTTAVQFTITNDTGAILPVSAVCLKSDSKPLNGGFALNIGSLGTDGYEDCTYTGINNESSRVVGIQFPASGSKAVNLGWGSADNAKKTLTFTLFLNPAYDVNDLTFYVFEEGGLNSDGSFIEGSKYRYAAMKDSDGHTVRPLTFAKHRKTYVTGLFVPEGAVWHLSLDAELTAWDTGVNTGAAFAHNPVTTSLSVQAWQTGSTGSLTMYK